ncbi:alpha/beta hydrolase [Gordonia hydrophobica]|uniref:Alpha/beta hydrolase n=1 Tax=Gordonia hydrophobica TaxID=40516 RepID=A0ABZ2U331_9ACTN|nr:alpha/beta hydrolase [Gordonia hydrophobica]MBM7367605.1 alpha-beta hydrolase superfamily lysophospholipase [Gordonia hydrophobica]
MSIVKSRRWRSDEFLDGFQSLPLPLGDDPDGDGLIEATLVRAPGNAATTNGAVLYVHGFTDYFFQADLAEFFTDRGYAFYAVDLRRCGRSLRDGDQPHFVTDLAFYDRELTAALDVIVEETGLEGTGADDASAQVIVAGHSTGGLITPLWLNRLRESDPERHRHIAGLVLNSPWLDLQGSALLRTGVVGGLIKGLGAIRARTVVPRELSGAYGDSLHVSRHGEWSYDLRCKPLSGFPVTFGWLAAVRAGQHRLHRGIDVGVPALVLRSDKTRFTDGYRTAVDTADCVLNVKQIAQWSAMIGRTVWAVAVPDARHDVFLSLETPRRIAYGEVQTWLNTVFGEGVQQ